MRRFLALIACTVSAANVSAETAYVTDVLVLGLHRAQDTRDDAFTNLRSGAELEVLERVPNYARVRTTDGQEGWVRSAFLVSDKPARLIVDEIQAELEAARGELARAQGAAASAQDNAARLSRQMEASAQSSTGIRETLVRVSQENEDYAARLERYRRSVPLAWAAAAVAVAAGVGFVLGLWWLDAFIRRRHGGYRIY
jgi:SH3 domain protein